MNTNGPKSIFHDIYSLPYKDKFFKLSRRAKDDGALIQRFGLMRKLEVHQGCVNTICWNATGERILSGSDDQHLVVTNGHSYKVEANYRTSHHANIFSAKFLPCSGDKQIISCSGDGIILHTHLDDTKSTYYNQFSCHAGTTYEVITIPNDPNTFMSCGEDGTVRWFDLRTKTSCRKSRCKDDVLVACQRAVTALAVNPTAPHQLAVGCADSTVRIYDRRCLSTHPEEHMKAQPFCSFIAPNLEDRRYRITSLSYSAEGRDMLVSYSSDYVYLFRIQSCHSNDGGSQVVELVKKPAKLSSPWEKVKKLTTGGAAKRERFNHSPPPVRRLRLRGDWSDTGPDARPERDNTATVSIGQARPQLHGTLMQRMTEVLSQMLNDPMTRAALSAGGEDSLDPTNEEASTSSATSGATSTPNQNENTNDDDNDNGDDDDDRTPILTPLVPTREDDNEEGSSSRPENNNETDSNQQIPSTSSRETSGGESSACVTNLYSQLTTLRNLRDGFIEQHGAEPSVSLRYSQQSTANATISLKVDDIPSPSVVPSTPSTSSATSSTRPQPSMANPSTSGDVDFDGNYDDDDDDDDDEVVDAMISSESAVAASSENECRYEATMKQKYVGHRNARTMIKEACFWGDDYVMSGSDCGHVFVWNRHTGKLTMLLQADQHVVNCLQPHPTLPILATSGIDHDVKLWAPILDESDFDHRTADDLINRNAIMLEETRDTITVPAAFMIRMLACLNQIRRGTRARFRSQDGEDDNNS